VGASIGVPWWKRETSGEAQNARNVGQLGTWGNGDAVNKLRGNRREEGNWLLR
jgi:predicted transport protein